MDVLEAFRVLEKSEMFSHAVIIEVLQGISNARSGVDFVLFKQPFSKV